MRFGNKTKMARLCQLGDGLRAIFVIFSVAPSVLPLNENYFYNIEDAYSDPFLFKMDVVHLQKREIVNEEATTTADPYTATHDQRLHQFNFSKATGLISSKDKNLLAWPTTTTPLPISRINMSPPRKNNHSEEDEDDDISLSKFSDSSVNFNDTLKEHNITITRSDTHLYYNSSFKTDAKFLKTYWVDITNKSDVKISELLSKSHRRAATVRLTFDFPFYGHFIRNVTIATGGFLYTGDYVHSWLAATQYIAPLMANFDTSLSNDSYIKYYDNGTAFTVLWENVSLQDKPDDGKFTFQVTLHSSGDIVFVYKHVPTTIEQIQDLNHPVKVGLSDAYIIDRTIFFVRRKTIYEYHRVDFRDVKNFTVIYLTALPTCPGIKDCVTCLTKELQNFKCLWCPTLNKCSNGLDRSRQDWLTKNCEKRQIKNETECSGTFPPETFEEHDVSYSHETNFDTIDDPTRASSRISHDSSTGISRIEPVHMAVSSIIAVLFIAALTVALGFWMLYAYRNPHTTSGQILIRYRPSQWSWRRGEARYTAATIHM